MKDLWAPAEIIKLYRTSKTKTSIYRDEEAGRIPEAQRIKRGNSKIMARYWKREDLPKLGEHYGFLEKPNGKKIVTVYTPKGGVLKSTLAFNLARALALHNIKVLVIGLDVQCTITHNLKLEEDDELLDSLEGISDIPDLCGLAHGEVSIKEVIKETSLPTLFYIPESPSLNRLEQKIQNEDIKREEYLTRLLDPIKDEYDVIIFDNSPNWNFLIRNSLYAATDVICPIACDVETYRSLNLNIEMINKFKDKARLDWNSFILVPTKLERNKLSTSIEAQYRTVFSEFVTAGTIRAAVKGQESSMEQLSVIEHDPSSPLAEDYHIVLQDVWRRINDSQEHEPNIEAARELEEA